MGWAATPIRRVGHLGPEAGHRLVGDPPEQEGVRGVEDAVHVLAGLVVEVRRQAAAQRRERLRLEAPKRFAAGDRTCAIARDLRVTPTTLSFRRCSALMQQPTMRAAPLAGIAPTAKRLVALGEAVGDKPTIELETPCVLSP